MTTRSLALAMLLVGCGSPERGRLAVATAPGVPQVETECVGPDAAYERYPGSGSLPGLWAGSGSVAVVVETDSSSIITVWPQRRCDGGNLDERKIGSGDVASFVMRQWPTGGAAIFHLRPGLLYWVRAGSKYKILEGR